MILEVSGGVLSSLIFDQLHTTSDQVFFNILYVHYMLHLFSVLYWIKERCCLFITYALLYTESELWNNFYFMADCCEWFDCRKDL